MEEEPKNKGGRPSLLDTIPRQIIKKLCELGATDKDLAEAFEVTPRTIENWKVQDPEFFQTLKDWKLVADSKVERSLYNRANGFTRTVQRLDKNGDARDLKEEMPPDPTSMIFWLKNRQPEKWRDKQEHEIGPTTLQAVLQVIQK